MKVLVTGGAGYIGSITVAKLINEGFEVNVLDDLSTGHKENIHPKANFYEGSILDALAIDKAVSGCDIVIHLAAKSIVSESVEKPELYEEVNVQGTRILYERATKNKVAKFIFASTASVYSPNSNQIVNEESEINPNNPYGETKAKAEKLIESLNLLNSTTAVVFRFFNVAGAYKSNNFKDLYEEHEPETHLIPNLVTKNETNEFFVFGNDYDTLDGTCVRDYLHVLDIVQAFLLAIKSNFRNSFNLINLGTAKGFSVLDVIEQYKSVFKCDVNVQYKSRRKGDIGLLVTSNFKARALIGWVPNRGIADIFNDYKN
jgi:UDP-glucose 4-epimerase